ncbi:MAG: HAMP domain-containing histidine kinase [Oscillospiraceae bacterium]|jgi:signal transduction histidine kinase|nr:HAMP domain-containing histidine kinase [Oscillospiraceae bacterium]
MNKDNEFLKMLSVAAVIVKDDTVTASNSATSESLAQGAAAPVFVRISDNEAEIDGVRYRQVAALNGGAWLYIKVSDISKDQYAHMLNNLCFILREELSVSGAAAELLKNKLEAGEYDAVTKYVKIIQKSQSQLIRLGDNLKEVSEPIDITPGKTAVHFRKLCRNLTGSISALVDDCSITFYDRSNCPDEDMLSAADPERVENMLLNLISNAIKYGDRREVKLILNKNGGHILISVVNHAESVWSDSLNSVFRAYMTDASARDGGGAGFGLMAAQHIAQLHGGNIISSTHNNEITFTVSIPKTDVDPSKLDDYGERDSGGGMRRLLIALSDVISWEKYGAPYFES